VGTRRIRASLVRLTAGPSAEDALTCADSVPGVKRNPALDGLRALAVAAVVVFHTSPAAHGGFIGVDVFFVVSGFLITTLLLREVELTGRVDLRAFYLRRALRLLPALLLMIAITVPLMLTSLRHTVLMPPWAAVGSAVFYVANWANVAVSTGTGPLTHTWSLSIEEQYYLLWPLVLLAVVVRGRYASLARGLAVAAALVVVSRALLWAVSPGEWLFYATTSRADGLLLGTLLAVVLARREPGRRLLAPRWSEGLAWTGLLGLAALMAVLRPDGGATFVGGLFLASACAVLVVHHVATADDGPLVRLLSLRPLVVVGTVSYGIYLFHFPVFQAVQEAHPPWLLQHALELGLTAALTTFSYLVVERPALRLKSRFARLDPDRTTPLLVSRGRRVSA
jgi:peptidoglycan/LPS O-acetylase OafA/YrhL